MLKNILNLEGAQKLTATEQKAINGAGPRLELCEDNTTCVIPRKCTLNPNTGGWYCV
ncbi:MAG: hypothetical protein ABI426_03755 [Flavobacterium sp.]